MRKKTEKDNKDTETKMYRVAKEFIGPFIEGTGIVCEDLIDNDYKFTKVDWDSITEYKNGKLYLFNDKMTCFDFRFFNLNDSKQPIMFKEENGSSYNLDLVSLDYPTSILIPEYASFLLDFIMNRMYGSNPCQPFVKISLLYPMSNSINAHDDPESLRSIKYLINKFHVADISYSRHLILKLVGAELFSINERYVSFKYIVAFDKRNPEEIEPLRILKERRNAMSHQPFQSYSLPSQTSNPMCNPNYFNPGYQPNIPVFFNPSNEDLGITVPKNNTLFFFSDEEKK